MAIFFSTQHRTPTILLLPLVGAGTLFAAGGCDSDGGGSTATSTTSSSSGTGGATTSSGTGGATTTSSGTGGSSGVGGGIDCGPMPAAQAPPLQLTQVASGLTRPIFVTGAPADSSRLYIVEQGGRIKLLSGGTVLGTPFLNIDPIVIDSSNQDEFGLLGLAFHPDYAQNGRFFVFYVANNGDSILAEYARSAGDPDVAEQTAVSTLLTITQGGGNHYSGMLAFGSDGYLYVGSGDRGTSAEAQNIMERRGKILRLDVDNHPTPPPGNLPGGDQYVWDLGVRNPWRFSFDRCSGDLYFGEVGGAFEEINIETAGQGHRNYGWPTVDTGTTCDSGQNCTGISLAVVEDDHSLGSCSYVGGYVYRGSLIPAMNGRYIYGDYCANRVWSFVRSGTGISMQEELTANLSSTDTIQALSSFGEDAAGNLYVVDLAGSIYRIDPE